MMYRSRTCVTYTSEARCGVLHEGAERVLLLNGLLPTSGHDDGVNSVWPQIGRHLGAMDHLWLSAKHLRM